MNFGKEITKKWKASLPTVKVRDMGDEQYAAKCPECGKEIYVISPG